MRNHGAIQPCRSATGRIQPIVLCRAVLWQHTAVCPWQQAAVPYRSSIPELTRRRFCTSRPGALDAAPCSLSRLIRAPYCAEACDLSTTHPQ